ncbi:MAG: cyclic 2,3-diphosphoglycerate synthase [Actinomycetota bacterium]
MNAGEGTKRKVVVIGAAGRDFHNFNVVYRGDPSCDVIAFTATQIPGIEGRTYPPELAGDPYPDGIQIVPEDDLEDLLRSRQIDDAVFSYSDVSHETVMHLASRCIAAGANFVVPSARDTMLPSEVPLVAVCAVRTGSGKSQTTRYVTKVLREAGKKVAVIRHPMPYGDLAKQRVQRFATYEDLDLHDCTIEEREEYEPHIDAGSIVYAGIDYEAIIERAQAEADIVVWDGGNNDLPFYEPDVHITVADPLRAGHELSYHPGEANLRMADVVVINKIDSAEADDLERLRKTIATVNPDARVVEAHSPVTLDGDVDLKGKKVLVVEDGPTLTHGEMAYGAGVVIAERMGATLVDPRPFAAGSIKDVYERYPHIGELLPAMGYSAAQRKDLADTINASDADAVLVATPIDLRKVVEIDKPAVRARYELEVVSEPSLADILRERLSL